jgi:uncharacterized membrane protein
MSEVEELKYKVDSLQRTVIFGVMIILSLLSYITFKTTDNSVFAIFGIVTGVVAVLGAGYDMYKTHEYRKLNKVKMGDAK